jgi:cyclic beta-1,2-glucan synthetase
MEWVLGLQVRGDTLIFNPCIPKAWHSYTISYQHEQSRYDISIENPNGVTRGVILIELDGKRQASGNSILLHNDEQVHQVRVMLG